MSGAKVVVVESYFWHLRCLFKRNVVLQCSKE